MSVFGGMTPTPPASLAGGNPTVGFIPSDFEVSAGPLRCEYLSVGPGVVGGPRAVLPMVEVVVQICQLDRASDGTRASAGPGDARHVDGV